jgi:hypothetical protein
MSMVGFPLLLIPLAIYNIIVFLMPGVSFADPLLKLKLMSGAEWSVSLSDMLLGLGILLLLSEVIKSARPGGKFLTDHLLSLVVFAAAAAEFVLLPQFGTSTYCLLALLAFADFLTGIALRARRRTQVAPAVAAPAPVTPDPGPPPKPEFVPVHQPSAPASVAESVLMDHPEPKVTRPPATPSEPPVVRTEPPVTRTEPSPEVPSPELQPGNPSPPPPDAPKR